jgi:phosphonatase-like hydrolase
MPRLQLAIFDMAGTTVDDLIDGMPLVLKSYSDAFEAHGVYVPKEVLNEQRGRDKWTVISELGGGKATKIFETFLRILNENTSRVKEVQGASDTFRYLRTHSVVIYVSTGFPKIVAEAMIEHLGWLNDGLIDGWLCSEQVSASRPDPAMILEAMRRHEVTDPTGVLKVDDTAKGIEEGKNAGVHTIGVLTGTQSIQRLNSASPHSILRSVAELPIYLSKEGLI